MRFVFALLILAARPFGRLGRLVAYRRTRPTPVRGRSQRVTMFWSSCLSRLLRYRCWAPPFCKVSLPNSTNPRFLHSQPDSFFPFLYAHAGNLVPLVGFPSVRRSFDRALIFVAEFPPPTVNGHHSCRGLVWSNQKVTLPVFVSFIPTGAPPYPPGCLFHCCLTVCPASPRSRTPPLKNLGIRNPRTSVYSSHLRSERA